MSSGSSSSSSSGTELRSNSIKQRYKDPSEWTSFTHKLKTDNGSLSCISYRLAGQDALTGEKKYEVTWGRVDKDDLKSGGGRSTVTLIDMVSHQAEEVRAAFGHLRYEKVPPSPDEDTVWSTETESEDPNHPGKAKLIVMHSPMDNEDYWVRIINQDGSGRRVENLSNADLTGESGHSHWAVKKAAEALTSGQGTWYSDTEYASRPNAHKHEREQTEAATAKLKDGLERWRQSRGLSSAGSFLFTGSSQWSKEETVAKLRQGFYDWLSSKAASSQSPQSTSPYGSSIASSQLVSSAA
nr:uncharacterized protein CI109_007025 [Kwoniella shandongensis]KAA5524639.1 hypothetical protein CI109_007025 [Kwoniella shandongensis]